MTAVERGAGVYRTAASSKWGQELMSYLTAVISNFMYPLKLWSCGGGGGTRLCDATFVIEFQFFCFFIFLQAAGHAVGHIPLLVCVRAQRKLRTTALLQNKLHRNSTTDTLETHISWRCKRLHTFAIAQVRSQNPVPQLKPTPVHI